ncbi:MAG: hypothetical protein WDO16_18425 [Bacteroidota bacterium]
MKLKPRIRLRLSKTVSLMLISTGKIDGKGNMEQGGMKIDMDMRGEQKGKINVGLADGYLKDSQITMDLNADMNIMGQKVPMTMKASYLIKGDLR